MLPKNNYNNFYCPAIWKQVHLSTNGEILPCCVYKNDGKSEYIKDSNLEVHNSDIFINDRKKILDKKVPKGCIYCVKQEAQNIKSHREHLIDKLSPVMATLAPIETTPVRDKSLKVGNEEIEYLDVRLGNTCNFMCNFCGPSASHLLAKEALKAIPTLFSYKEALNLHQFNNKDVFEKFLKSIDNYPNLKWVHIAGGEPFYMKKELLMLLDAIKNKSQVKVRILTNVSVYDEEIIKKLDDFNKVSLMLSIDSVGKAIEISRWKSNWKLLDENVTKFLELKLKHSPAKYILQFVPAISVFTVMNLPNFLKYVINKKIRAEILFIQDPVEQVVNLLDSEQLRHVKKELRSFEDQKSLYKWCNYDEVLNQLDYYIKNNNVDNSIIREFWKKQDVFEKYRKYSLKKEMPFLHSIIKKV